MSGYFRLDFVLAHGLFCYSYGLANHVLLHVYYFYCLTQVLGVLQDSCHLSQVVGFSQGEVQIFYQVTYLQIFSRAQETTSMSGSPYISNQVKQYMRKYEIQKLINTSVNELLHTKPEDPYGYLIGILQKNASQEIEIKNIKPYDMLSGEGMPTIRLYVTVNYLNKDVEFVVSDGVGILGEEAVQFEGGDKYGGKGLAKVVAQIEQIVGKVVGYKCSNQPEIDKVLQALYAQKGANWLHAINTLSYTIPKIQAQTLNKPLYSIISKLSDSKSSIPPPNLSLLINCLHGGKAIGSKCKVFKYMILSKQACKDPYVAQNILLAVRKTIVSGKGGEAALKYSGDGTFVCPVDTILDNLKIVEDAINGCNAKDMFGIGLSWAADTLYSPDTKKYELQNPKTPFDNDQMIDYLVKLCTDKPIITYLEDPLAATQLAAWKKLKTKLSETEALKHVRLGTRNQKLLPITVNPFSQESIKTALSNLSVVATKDSHPDLTPEQLQQTNLNKFSLDFVQLRMFELKTLSNIIKLAKLMSKTNTKLILQDNLYESYDTSIVDVCYGIGAIIGLGSISGKFDRVCKLNRIREIQIVSKLEKQEESTQAKSG